MAVIRQLKVKDSSNTLQTYDIGSTAENVSYTPAESTTAPVVGTATTVNAALNYLNTHVISDWQVLYDCGGGPAARWLPPTTGSGTLSLSNPFNNYRFILFYTASNQETFTDILPGDIGFGYAVSCSHILYDSAKNAYCSWISVSGATDGSYIISGGGNNANWRLGVIKVYGLK